MPKISVIIPTYNRAHLLPRAIKSVLNQTFKDFELIVVDDGSTDNTREVIEEFQKKDERIKYFWQRNSGGPSAPLNLGISHSGGLYVTFLGSDDECSSVWLEKQMKLFDFPEAKKPDVVSCDIKIINQNNEKMFQRGKPKNLNNDFILANLINEKFLLGNIIANQNVFRKVGIFDEKIKYGEDLDMWIRIARAGFKFGFVREPLLLVKEHPHQLSKDIYSARAGRLFLFKKTVKKNPIFLFKYPVLFKKIIVLQGYKFIQDFFRIFIKQ